MTKYENHCCDCATPNYPCIGKLCPLRRVVVHYCDNPKCSEPLDDIFVVDGKEYCEECLKDMFRR